MASACYGFAIGSLHVPIFWLGAMLPMFGVFAKGELEPQGRHHGMFPENIVLRLSAGTYFLLLLFAF